ncbi:MAG TPA: MarR family transcriptional regulator [Candidatus Dormibacteraeota bacterium]|nr:MarR family transcriptional regulator [Candidatus Dormibacteraeota bacterium]
MRTKAREASQEQVTTWINLHQAVRVLQARIEARLQAETELSWAEFELLMRLQVAADHPLQMSEIAAQLVGSPSGTTRIADRLERADLIARETPRENRRIVRVSLTDKGRRVLATADEVFRTSLQEAFGDHMTETELEQLRKTLRKLLEKNGAWQEARCSPGAAAAS